MDYLLKTLGIRVTYEKPAWQDMPLFIEEKYSLKSVSIDGVPAVFVYSKDNLEDAETLKKHLKRIETECHAYPVLILANLSTRERHYLIDRRIPFVVENKQIYLPFMAISMQQRCSEESIERTELSPSAQVLFLYFIYQGARALSASEIQKGAKLSKIAISRAGRELVSKGMLKEKKEGKRMLLFSDLCPKALFETSKAELLNPVKRSVFVDKNLLGTELFVSGHSALSSLSMLCEEEVPCFAANSISKWEGSSTGRLCDAGKQARVEFWRYDPSRLSSGKEVDPLSLALSLQDDSDERVEQALEGMLDDLWRELDGKGN